MKFLVFILFIFSSALFAEINTEIITDAEFTNYNAYSIESYIAVFSDRMSEDDIRHIVYWYRRCGINPLVGFVTMLKEGMPRDNYAFGYGIHLDRRRRSTTYQAFDRQVRYSAHCFMRHYLDGQRSTRAFIYTTIDAGEEVEVANASTYALYRYTPLWKVKYPNDTHGNFVFDRVWRKYKKLMGAV